MNIPLSTLIIDDEPPARTRLLQLLLEFPKIFTVLDTAKNGTEALSKIKLLPPDVIFLDIEMPGLNGFELLENLENIPIVIFCTAYDHYSLKAFETNSIDYLMKPVRKERLEKTIYKLQNVSQNLSQASLKHLIERLNLDQDKSEITTLTVKEKDSIRFIKLEDILYFESSDKYVTVYTEGKKQLCEQSLSQLEAKLPVDFIRIKRSLIINKRHVKEVFKYFNSRYKLILKDKAGTQLISGRSFKKELELWLSN